jgi:hypothetical protein
MVQEMFSITSGLKKLTGICSKTGKSLRRMCRISAVKAMPARKWRLFIRVPSAHAVRFADLTFTPKTTLCTGWTHPILTDTNSQNLIIPRKTYRRKAVACLSRLLLVTDLLYSASWLPLHCFVRFFIPPCFVVQ